MEIVHNSTGNKKAAEQEEQKLYEILSELPKPETKFGLTASQKYWWFWFGKEFVKTNQFSKLDLVHLQTAAIWLDARNNCLKKINKLNRKDPDKVKGWVQTFANGANNVTGYVSILEKAGKHIDTVSAHFGLSIKDRQKLDTAETNEKQMNWMKEFFGDPKPSKAN